MSGKPKVAILHPDLGIGGAENLIVNLALALEKKNYQVKIYTPHFDPNRCFQECHQLDIEVAGSWFPRTVFGRCIAYCAYIRMLLCAIYVAFFSGVNYDYYVLDQVSFPIPILKLKTSRIVFYCHFPDKLLSTNRSGMVMQFYRYFLDYIEEVTTGMAQTIVVNSLFTQRVFQKHFPIIADQGKGHKELNGMASMLVAKRHLPQVLYPFINPKTFIKSPDYNKSISELLGKEINQSDGCKIFTSLNRYERKKNIGLAIEAFSIFQVNCLRSGMPASDIQNKHVLVIAGGWDPRVRENVEHEQELRRKAAQLNIQDNVIFLKSISNDDRLLLLDNTEILLYTPENEHFGIVPVEAMHLGTVVMACDNGGPLESIEHGKTGFNLKSDARIWGNQMHEIVYGKSISVSSLQSAAKSRVKNNFTLEVFGDKLDQIMKETK